MVTGFSSVDEVGAAYRSGATTPSELLAELLNRIRRLDTGLNSFAAVLDASAVEAAERATGELRRGIDRGPLHGVPVAVKDLIAVRGAATRFGSRVGGVAREPSDATVVARLRRAGAVIVGKTNLLEYAYGVPHPTVGPTANPWNPARTAGGSSGGSAAAVAAGFVPAALGTDTGGSIRIPASYCGIVGFKPTWDRLPMDGIFPLAWSLDVVGPLARTVEDAATLFHALDGSTGSTVDTDRDDLDGTTIGVPWTYIDSVRLAPGVRTMLERMIQAARAAGARLVDFDFRDFADSVRLLLDLLMPEASVVHEPRLRDDPTGYAPGTRTQLERGSRLPAVDYVRAQRAQARLRALHGERMRGVEALLTPAVPFPAPAEDPEVDDADGVAEMHFSGPFNFMGVPSVTLPGGLVDGLPVGVQLSGRFGHDEPLLALAAALEAVTAPLPPLPEPFGAS